MAMPTAKIDEKLFNLDWIVFALQGQRHQSQRSNPAFCALIQTRYGFGRNRHWQRLMEKRLCLVKREAQFIRTDLVEFVARAEASKGQRRIVARENHQMQ